MTMFGKQTLWAVLGAATGAAAMWAVNDYKQWKSLGRGGVPDNVWGWLIVRRLGLQALETRGSAQYDDRIGTPGDVCRLGDLPVREGTRPRMGKHVVPHRQLDQGTDPTTRKLLDKIFDDFVDANGRYVRYAKSYYEKRNDAVTLTRTDAAHPVARTSHGEVAHVHPGDGSMHMIFSPSDAKQVIDKGWGERHPLSGSPHHDIPDTYLMVYVPRTPQEVMVVAQLLRAAVEGIGLCDCQPA